MAQLVNMKKHNYTVTKITQAIKNKPKTQICWTPERTQPSHASSTAFCCPCFSISPADGNRWHRSTRLRQQLEGFPPFSAPSGARLSAATNNNTKCSALGWSASCRNHTCEREAAGSRNIWWEMHENRKADTTHTHAHRVSDLLSDQW